MDLTSSWFLVVIVVLGGGVAALADNIGRTLGKKRLRLGRMRPKHTALFLTALTGMIVTLTTIALVAALSAEAREWIVRGRTAIREGRIAEEKLKSTQANLAEATQKLKDSSEKAQRLTKSLGTVRSNFSQAQKSLEAAQQDVRKAEERSHGLDRRAQALAFQVRQGTASLRSVEKQLGDSQLSFDKVQKQLKVTLGMREEAESRYESLQDDLDAMENQKGLSEQELKKVAANLQKTLDSLREADKKYAEALQKYQTDLGTLQGQLEEAGKQLSAYQGAASYLFGKSRIAPMIFAKGEELARMEIDPLGGPDDAQFALRKVLAAARQSANTRGALADSSGSSAGFVGYEDPQTKEPITPEMQARDVIRQMLSAPGPKFLVASASFNAFKNEFVPVDIIVHENPILFKAGEVISETRIEGDAEQQEIFDKISEFVHTKVRARAVEKGMVPIPGAEASFGNATSETIFRVITQIREFGRVVRLQAVAKADTRAAGPLELEFKVR